MDDSAQGVGSGTDASDARRLRQTLDGAVEHAIIEMDKERRVRGWNIGAEHLFGLSADEILGQPADVIFTPEDCASGVPDREAEQALEMGRAEDTRYHLRGDGSRFWASGTMTPLRDPDGKPDGLLKIVRDQSSMRTAEESLVRALDVARRSDEARGRLMAVAGHDLRQPLQVIGMALDLLRPRLDGDDARGKRYLGQAQEAFARLTVDLDALAHASALSTEVGSDNKTFPIADVLTQIGPRWRHHAAAKGLTLRLRSSRALVRSDPVMLATIVNNLVGNAIKYTSQGGVLIGCRSRRTRLYLDVIDTGVGILPEVQEAIFGDFAQLDPDSDGLGLGLSIVRRTAAVLGHAVRVQSEPGRGSRFTVEMPRVHATARKNDQASMIHNTA